MIPPRKTVDFFTKANFAFDKEALLLQGGGVGALFRRTPASLIGAMVNLYKEKHPLEKGDANFLKTVWAPLTMASARGMYQTLIDSFGETPETPLESTLGLINSLGWGKVQIVERNSHKSCFRLFHSFEDRLFVEKFGKAPCPISAYAAGMLLATHIYVNAGEKENRPMSIDPAVDSVEVFDQERCEAEGQPYGEFLIISRR